jgi:acyl carrier protein
VRRDAAGFLGRVDDQLKIRGFRIEPGEIEAILLARPDITAAAVIAREDRSGGTQLVAYLVPATGHTVDLDRLREHLATTLPHYMIPTSFVTLDTLPLAANGKLNSSALPDPEYDASVDALYVPPSTEAESIMAQIWSEVLGIVRIGVEDNYFALGGDSITSIRLVSRVRAAFGVELTPRVLFTNPTVAGLVRALPLSASFQYVDVGGTHRRA